MSKIEILDCTLRDGGYVNDWNFGTERAQNIIKSVYQSSVDFIELGFIRECNYNKGTLQFSEVSQILDYTPNISEKIAIMVEMGYGYPISSFPERINSNVDLIRIVMWKRNLDDGYEYCRQLQDKGYKVALQLTRSDQYEITEFADIVGKFSRLNPYAIYIVDTFGLYTKSMLEKYAQAATETISPQTRLGYHSHNNMQQAFANAVAFAEMSIACDKIIDGSVMGIGRGAGNLPLELILTHLNESNNCSYDLDPLYKVADECIKPIFEESPWGYSIPYLLSAKYGCNPNYASLLTSLNLKYPKMQEIMHKLVETNNNIKYDEQYCLSLVNSL